ncbi:SAM-dependent methyltransferase [Streptomyces sp. NPDC059564]|uniref:SAM-dependent methyltransferase n=1 Tax=Streptomyces sp. NPDC059564 TaxID=3346865 RepID=UPI00367B24D4
MTAHFVGAGPGAADLITVRGRELLGRCGLCLYPGSMTPTDLLAFCPPDASVVDASNLPLGEAVARIVAAHRRGLDVVRPCSGDPSLYSTVAEQTELLRVAVIPEPLRVRRTRLHHDRAAVQVDPEGRAERVGVLAPGRAVQAQGVRVVPPAAAEPGLPIVTGTAALVRGLAGALADARGMVASTPLIQAPEGVH